MCVPSVFCVQRLADQWDSHVVAAGRFTAHSVRLRKLDRPAASGQRNGLQQRARQTKWLQSGFGAGARLPKSGQEDAQGVKQKLEEKEWGEQQTKGVTSSGIGAGRKRWKLEL